VIYDWYDLIENLIELQAHPTILVYE